MPYTNCKDQIWLEPRTGMDPGPQIPNNKFVECGIKSQSGSRAKILDYRVRRKELYIHISTKSILGHAIVLSLESTQFFLFFLLLPFFFLPPYYILWFFYRFPHPHVDQAFKVFFFFSLLPFLESSILSWKAACSLFRHHFHINVARRLVGRHLMRR